MQLARKNLQGSRSEYNNNNNNNNNHIVSSKNKLSISRITGILAVNFRTYIRYIFIFIYGIYMCAFSPTRLGDNTWPPPPPLSYLIHLIIICCVISTTTTSAAKRAKKTLFPALYATENGELLCTRENTPAFIINVTAVLVGARFAADRFENI